MGESDLELEEMIHIIGRASPMLIPSIRRIEAIELLPLRSTPKLWIIGAQAPEIHYNDITRSLRDTLNQERHEVIQEEQWNPRRLT